MSKAKLRKELATFSNEQLVDLVLSAYDSSKEARDYFEFFLEPDADTLLEKKIDAIAKEIMRSKWGYSKARITVIRAHIKGFAAYGVGADYVSRLMLDTIRMLVGMEQHLNYQATLVAGIGKLVGEYVCYCHTHGMLPQALEAVAVIVSDPKLGTASMRKNVQRWADAALQSLPQRAL